MRGRGWGGRLALAGAIVYVAARLVGGAFAAGVAVPYRGFEEAPVRVVVPRGATAEMVAGELEEAGVVRDRRWLLWWLRLTGQAGRIQAGEYRFTEAVSLRQVTETLVTGRVVLHSLTVPEGSSRWQVAELLAGSGLGSADEALAATAQIELIDDLDPRATDLEGYLFPDTYFFPATAAAAEVVELMVRRFRRLWTPRRQAAAERLGMDLREVVTLASLIEAETAQPHERPLVSAVFHNRLGRGMLLQCDPTLLYALRLAGRTDRNIRWADFAIDSPYNTYRYPGLPPGPIGSPGEASLDAALSPAEVDYLYFVARNDGTHVFSRTLREHNAMVDRYQRRGRGR